MRKSRSEQLRVARGDLENYIGEERAKEILDGLFWFCLESETGRNMLPGKAKRAACFVLERGNDCCLSSF